MTGGRRVLVVSNDVVGRAMAGPGIRYYHFARELARRHEVTLVAPREVDLDLESVRVVVAPRLGYSGFKQLVRGFDVVVAQQLSTRAMRHLAASPVRAIYDLYNPFVSENLGLLGGRSGRHTELTYSAGVRLQEIALATGDAFVCASERQRDLWLGVLSALGRIDLARHRVDPTFRDLVDVVPFGLEPAAPTAGEPALKGVHPAIAPDDRVLLWAGGIWNWFDPLTLIEAVARLARRRDDVRLVFLAGRHPNPRVGEMSMAEQAVERARRLGVEGRSVLFVREWVPYDRRADYLLEADVGVSSHFEGLETRFAFRTRILDYLWAGLPIVTTRGDVLAELVERHGLGATVPERNAEAWEAALERLLDDRAAHDEARRAIVDVRARFAWPAVIETLSRLVESDVAAPKVPRRVTPMIGAYVARAVGGHALEHGPREAIAEAVRTWRRPRVP